MIRNNEQARRPLVIGGDSRQMLQEIRNSLSHHLKPSRQPPVNPGGQEGFAGDMPSGPPLGPNLSQSTPNIFEKSGVNGAGKPKNYTKQALEDIRNTLRPFQCAHSNTNSSTTSQGSEDGEMERINSSQQRLDEELINQGSKGLDQSKKAEVQAMNLIEKFDKMSKQNGLSFAAHSNVSKMRRKGSFGTGSPDSSVRSDSPGINSVPGRQLPYSEPHRISSSQAGNTRITPSPITNGNQTPPPVPPRVPIMSPVATPPPSQQGVVKNGTPSSQQKYVQVHQPLAVSPHIATLQTTPSEAPKIVTQVHSLNRRMSPSPRDPARQPPVYNNQYIQNSTSPHAQPGSGPVTPQRGVSPVSVVRQPVIFPNNPSIAISQPYHGGSPGNVNGSSIPGNSGPRVTIKYTHPPPPYSQAQQSRAVNSTVTIKHDPPPTSQVVSSHQVLSDYSQQQVPKYEAQITVKSSTAETMSIQNFVTKRNTPTQPQPVQAWGAKQPPIVMQQVSSQKVSKPVLQTATPVAPLQSPGIGQNYISSVEAQVNGPPQASPQQVQQMQKQNSKGSVHIQIRSPGQNGGPHLTPDQIAHLQQGHHVQGHRPTIQINIGNQNAQGHHIAHMHSQGHHNSIQSVRINNQDFYHRSASDTPGSTPRSDSPVSRVTNQSPLSILSTASTPSTNSDIPDRPPPPYPGRPLQIQSHIAPLQPGHPVQIVQPIPQQQSAISQVVHSQRQSPNVGQSAQPPLPPRVPIASQVRPPPPLPPPISKESEQPPPLPPPKNVKTSQPPPSSSPKSQMIDQAMTKAGSVSEQNNDDTDTETLSTVSDASATQEKHRCTSPIPERKPEAKEKDCLRKDTLVRNYSPQAFKFFMEQHVENLMKGHKDRMHRRIQLENEMQKVGLSEEAQHQMRRMLSQKESNYIRLKRAKMDKAMFDKIQTLGIGAFGEVALVRKKDVHQLYAMKTLRKSDVLKRNQVAHVKAERDILAEADNEWVVKLYYSFQDRDNLYFVMDYVPGGDLMGLLIKFGIFHEDLSRFYIAELVLAIESVHRMGFIHRDIKPDNILIDKDGHIKLTDFGLCTGFRWTHNSKYYQKEGSHARQDSMEVSCMTSNPPEVCQCARIKTLERRRQRDRMRCLAHSLVGTPNYIAPEVLLRLGYTSCCDWWSVGVILYEMLVGQPPFYATTPQETQYKVIHWDKTLKIPPEANVSEAATDLILRLCCGADDRLGREGAEEIKQHRFFSGLRCDGLRRQTAPYIPQILHSMDTSNFDPIDTDKLFDNNNSDDEIKKIDHPENGKHPEHAFFEFTFRRFFDDGGHPYPSVKDADSATATSPVYV